VSSKVTTNEEKQKSIEEKKTLKTKLGKGHIGPTEIQRYKENSLKYIKRKKKKRKVYL
jgi:hypothetical protein